MSARRKEAGAIVPLGGVSKRGPIKVTTPRIYDIVNDDYREVTQLDVDQLVEISRAYGKLRHLLAADRTELLARLEQVKSRHGSPAGGKPVRFEGLDD